METTNVGTKTDRFVDLKSEILFLYESTYSIPNGDPFTGEQRYDDETKKVLVSDVRIKRFIRDYLNNNGSEVYVLLDRSNQSNEGKESGAAARMATLKKKYEGLETTEILKKCIDVRLFGGISTEKDDSINLTGPIQFALLNPSINKVDLRMHQNTTIFPSKMKNKKEEDARGSIGTTSVVPYSINQIHGWINPFSAKHTNLSDDDIELMFKALWESVNSANTRTKSNQNSLLLLQIIYSEPNKKLYGVDRLIKIKAREKLSDEQIRSLDDYDFDFTELYEAVRSDVVSEVLYYTEVDKIKEEFTDKDIFKPMDFIAKAVEVVRF